MIGFYVPVLPASSGADLRWRSAPVAEPAMQALLRNAGVIAIPDGLGGF